MTYYTYKMDSLHQLIPFPYNNIVWLDFYKDIDLIRNYYDATFGKGTFHAEEWEPDLDKWQFCALIHDNEIISFAGALIMTDKNWEIGAVSTLPRERNKGYATALISFIAKYILENGKEATLGTASDNFPMQRAALKIGMSFHKEVKT